jgi:glycosyltransferase 2 family protein
VSPTNDVPRGRSSGVSRLLRWAGSAAAVIAFVFVVVTLRKSVEAMPPIVFTWRLVVAAALGVGANVLVAIISATVWRTLLDCAGVAMRWRRSFAICGTAQIGKYLPGNVFHLAGRVAMAARAGVAVPVATASITVETLGVVGAGALVALPLVLARWASFQELLGMSTVAFWLLLASVAVVVAALGWWLARKGLRETFAAARGMLHPRTLLVVLAWDAASFVVLGASLFFIAETAWPHGSGMTLSSCIGAFALAWVLGFVTPGAPGGVGIREAVFLIVVAGAVDAGTGAAFGIVSRLQSVVGDIVIFALARAVGRREAPLSSKPPDLPRTGDKLGVTSTFPPP